VQFLVRRNRNSELTGNGTLMHEFMPGGRDLCTLVMLSLRSEMNTWHSGTGRIHRNFISGTGREFCRGEEISEGIIIPGRSVCWYDLETGQVSLSTETSRSNVDF